MKSKNNISTLEFTLIIIFFVFLGILVGVLLEPHVQEINNKTITVQMKAQDNFTKDCSNLSLRDSATCLRDSIALNYTYNLSNSDKMLMSDEELMKEGGACVQWSDFYSRHMSALGFSTTEVSFSIIPGVVGHQITIASDSTGYVLMDQLSTEFFGILLNDSDTNATQHTNVTQDGQENK